MPVASGRAPAQFAKLDWKLTTVGSVRQVLTNLGTLDKGQTRYPGLIMAEFPPGSTEEHLYQGGLWIGGINPNGDTLVSETAVPLRIRRILPVGRELGHDLGRQ